ncbi:uncharacterized protein LOC125236603 [Leguminivora glycinivorella]|uniref:uncharacterized protein LOC125226869 n=1 Tax=Leguminivora glycinivorella TaxID=1035111 RepID=UPI00200C1546|nr:uncharacterized protein LOC125226869 [Leguminivora glycinivorella]XP_047999423.1 uncharacterized protein LOC125236603 [Leguminivora glycinivorella]
MQPTAITRHLILKCFLRIKVEKMRIIMYRRKLDSVESNLFDKLGEKIRRVGEEDRRKPINAGVPRRHDRGHCGLYCLRYLTRSKPRPRFALYSRSPSLPAASRSSNRSPLVVIEILTTSIMKHKCN